MLVKEASETNFADLMTKHLPEDRMRALLRAAGYTFREGRAPGAPELAEGATKVRLACVRRSDAPGSEEEAPCASVAKRFSSRGAPRSATSNGNMSRIARNSSLAEGHQATVRTAKPPQTQG